MVSSTSIRTCRRFCSPRTRPTFERLFGVPNAGPFVKDAFHEAIVGGRADKVNPGRRGSKAAAHYHAIDRTRRMSRGENPLHRLASLIDPFGDFDSIVERRMRARPTSFTAPSSLRGWSDDQRRVQRQAYAGLLWTKQFYHYSVELWLDGDPAGPEPPPARRHGRNASWQHVYNLDVLSVPDKWEYPWFAAWDTAFHCIVLARLDPEWAKRQVVLLLREWYMHPSGQLPAYEWDFSDANPPVHARAARRVYEIARDADRRGRYRVSRGGLSQAAAQLHVVGQPQRPRGTQRLSGGLPRPGQHRRVRPQPAQPGRGPAARAGRRDRLDGRCFASTCWRSRSSCRIPGRPTRRSPPSFSSTSWPSRTPSTGSATRSACGTPCDRFLLRRGPGQGRTSAAPARSARSWV